MYPHLANYMDDFGCDSGSSVYLAMQGDFDLAVITNITDLDIKSLI